jgi:hypothetical protein
VRVLGRLGWSAGARLLVQVFEYPEVRALSVKPFR